MDVIKVLARGQVTLPRRVRREADIGAGDILHVEVLGPGRVQLTALPRLSPRELRERYPIEGPIDEAADRRDWQAVATLDVIGE